MVTGAAGPSSVAIVMVVLLFLLGMGGGWTGVDGGWGGRLSAAGRGGCGGFGLRSPGRQLLVVGLAQGRDAGMPAAVAPVHGGTHGHPGAEDPPGAGAEVGHQV